MDDEVMKRFRSQVETLSVREIEKITKKFDENELDMFMDVMDEYNVELGNKLSQIKDLFHLRLNNHRVLLTSVWSIIPEELRTYLAEHFNSINDVV